VHATSLPDEPTTITLRKLTPKGSEAWVRTLSAGSSDGSGWYERVFDVTARPGGGVVAVGVTDALHGPAMAFAYDGAGNELWFESHFDPDADANYFSAVGADATNAYVSGCWGKDDLSDGGVWWLSYPLSP
jgi:hypothetical protein